MTDNLHVARQGPPRSGEVIITDSELHHDDPRWQADYEYMQIARHFFNQFLQLKVQLDRGELNIPKAWRKEQADYVKLIDSLKKSLKDYATENQRMEEALALAEEEKTALLGRINELTISLGRALEKLEGLGVIREREERTGHSFRELMDEDSRRTWDALMREIPTRKDTR